LHSAFGRCPINHGADVVDVKLKHSAVVQIVAVFDVVLGHDGRRVIFNTGFFLDLRTLNHNRAAVNRCSAPSKRHLFNQNDFLAELACTDSGSLTSSTGADDCDVSIQSFIFDDSFLCFGFGKFVNIAAGLFHAGSNSCEDCVTCDGGAAHTVQSQTLAINDCFRKFFDGNRTDSRCFFVCPDLDGFDRLLGKGHRDRNFTAVAFRNGCVSSRIERCCLGCPRECNNAQCGEKY